MKLNLHTVYIPREHILFLEEWLLYHEHVGFDHFYMYDNTGSRGDYLSKYKNVQKSGRDKRGYDIGSLTGHLSDHDIGAIQRKIFDKFPGKITYEKWQPLNRDGEIWYGQMQAIQHYLLNHAEDEAWTGFFDIDELVVDTQFSNIKDCILNIVGKWRNVHDLIVPQSSYYNRYKIVDGDVRIRSLYQSQIFEKPVKVVPLRKHIAMNKILNMWKELNKKGIFSPHTPGVARKHQLAWRTGRYNHYNVPSSEENVGKGMWHDRHKNINTLGFETNNTLLPFSDILGNRSMVVWDYFNSIEDIM